MKTPRKLAGCNFIVGRGLAPAESLPLVRGGFFSCFLVLVSYVKLPVTVSVTVPGVTSTVPSGAVV